MAIPAEFILFCDEWQFAGLYIFLH